jgi:hypothetical protein
MLAICWSLSTAFDRFAGTFAAVSKSGGIAATALVELVVASADSLAACSPAIGADWSREAAAFIAGCVTVDK